MRDKRIMTLTVVTALGIGDLAEIQANAALANGELTEDELKEMSIFLTHYLGIPAGIQARRRGREGGQEPQEGSGEGRGRGQEGQRQRCRPNAFRGTGS